MRLCNHSWKESGRFADHSQLADWLLPGRQQPTESRKIEHVIGPKSTQAVAGDPEQTLRLLSPGELLLVPIFRKPTAL